jgi:phage terminase Nu1 subunit (DNA packaging protein)
MSAMDSTVTGPDLAKLFGVDVRSISDLARAGHVVRVSKGRYDLVASVQNYTAHLRSLAMGRGGEPAIQAGTAARARLAAAQASLAETKARVLGGSLLEAEAVEREWSAILSAIRARLLAVPSRAAQRLPHMTAHDVGEIDHEIRAALQELGEDRAAG